MSDIEILYAAQSMHKANAEMFTNHEHKIAAQALAILCRREIERMEAEANQERGAPSTGHPIHPPSYDEGWNAALSAVEAAVDGMPSTEGFTIRRCLDAIRSLRKGPSND